MITEFLVLLPPLIVILMATYTKNTRLSLIIGICSAALIINDFLIFGTFKTIFNNFLSAIEFEGLKSFQTIWSCEKIFILLFLLMLGIIIALLEHSGSAYAYGNYVTTKLKSVKNAELSSLVLSCFFFIDDYFSCLTVGSVMQPITDQFKIPRVKLALLVSSMAVPLAIIFPLSSWVAYVLGTLGQTGVSTCVGTSTVIQCDPFFLYLNTIPFLFYALIVVFSIWFIVLKRLSFGIVAKHEKVAQATGTLFGGKQSITRKSQGSIDAQSNCTLKNCTLWDFLLPIMLLIISTVAEILRSGDFFIFGGTNGIIQALFAANIAAALFKSSVFTTIVAIVYFVIRKRIQIKDLGLIIREGVSLMWSSLFLLILIWTFGKILKNDLQIGHFIAEHIGYINISYLPVILFLISGLVTTLMCSAWGSMGLIIPIGIPMLVSLSGMQSPIQLVDIPMIYPVLGAIISGAIIGNQLSPVADVMLMSAASSGCYHMDLVKAQASLTIPSIFSGALAFLCVGLLIPKCGAGISLGISLLIGILSNFTIIYILDRLQRRRAS
jgi:tetracycline resistance efflux pump